MGSRKTGGLPPRDGEVRPSALPRVAGERYKLAAPASIAALTAARGSEVRVEQQAASNACSKPVLPLHRRQPLWPAPAAAAEHRDRRRQLGSSWAQERRDLPVPHAPRMNAEAGAAAPPVFIRNRSSASMIGASRPEKIPRISASSGNILTMARDPDRVLAAVRTARIEAGTPQPLGDAPVLLWKK